MSINNPDIQARLKKLHDDYTRQLPDKLASAKALWCDICTENWDWKKLESLHHQVHTLAGSAPTFGFEEIGQNARSIERLLKNWLQDSHRADNTERAVVDKLFSALQATAP